MLEFVIFGYILPFTCLTAVKAVNVFYISKLIFSFNSFQQCSLSVSRCKYLTAGPHTVTIL